MRARRRYHGGRRRLRLGRRNKNKGDCYRRSKEAPRFYAAGPRHGWRGIDTHQLIPCAQTEVNRRCEKARQKE